MPGAHERKREEPRNVGRDLAAQRGPGRVPQRCQRSLSPRATPLVVLHCIRRPGVRARPLRCRLHRCRVSFPCQATSPSAHQRAAFVSSAWSPGERRAGARLPGNPSNPGCQALRGLAPPWRRRAARSARVVDLAGGRPSAVSRARSSATISAPGARDRRHPPPPQGAHHEVLCPTIPVAPLIPAPRGFAPRLPRRARRRRCGRRAPRLARGVRRGALSLAATPPPASRRSPFRGRS